RRRGRRPRPRLPRGLRPAGARPRLVRRPLRALARRDARPAAARLDRSVVGRGLALIAPVLALDRGRRALALPGGVRRRVEDDGTGPGGPGSVDGRRPPP